MLAIRAGETLSIPRETLGTRVTFFEEVRNDSQCLSNLETLFLHNNDLSGTLPS
ncbi:MAG: hypothetical protein GDA38_24790 [Hormoscilla sp. SP12CHS1]|nr:hypothetical protein [Hormoscilla sp. SP12CHS1]